MDRHGSYIRNEHGFKMCSSKYTVETILSCVKQNGKNNKVFLCHILSVKSAQNLRPFWSTTPILFILSLLSSLYSRRVFRKQYLFSCLHFEMISTFTSVLPYKGQLKCKIFLICLKIAPRVHKLRVADSFQSSTFVTRSTDFGIEHFTCTGYKRHYSYAK